MRFWNNRCWPGLKAAGIFGSFLMAGSALAFAQAPQDRVQASRERVMEAINANATVALPGSANPRVASQVPTGRLSPATPLDGVTIYFKPTAEQKAELDALVEAQQTPGSPEYHQWLTPAEYGGLFGLSTSDLAKVESWLTSEGFNVERVGNSHTSISFSGTVEQVENAFHTEMQQYVVDGEKHYSNATDLSIPAALDGVVQSVRNLDDFRPRPQVRYHTARTGSGTPAFTQATTDDHYLTPDDVSTIYDITPAYNEGETGSGVTIAVVGQSAINTADIENFQKAMGFAVKDPTIIFYGSASGTSTVVAGDESESDLDLEYSSGIGKGATIDFIYVGNNQSYSVFDSLQYAVDYKIGQIVSMSYGACEPTLSASDFSTLEGILEQGASQGQSVIAAAGDDGSTSCYGGKGLSTTEQQELAVNYPASSAYATGVGGTEFPANDVAAGNSTYWTQASGSDVISSALSYIPEQVWNDDSAAIAAQYGSQYALSAGGGGASTNIKRPSWQTGVTGIASGTYRLVPDIALDSSADSAGYLYCTSDTSAWSTGQKASCNSGFRDSSSGDLTIAGGTSFATPIFAGMLSIVNQKTSSSGEGVAASQLYTLASNAATYALAFHDIVNGSNKCTAGATYCSTAGASEYAATAGYDEASGLGSVDLTNLMDAWAGTTTGGGGGTGTGTFTLKATAVTVTQGSSATSTVTITPANSYAGTVGFTATSSSTSLNTYGCYAIGNTAVTAGAAATTTLTVYSSQSACTASGVHSFARKRTIAANHAPTGGQPLGKTIPLSAVALAGLLGFGFRRSRARMWLLMSCLMLFATVGLTVGCGSSSGSTTTGGGGTSTDVAAGTYTVTLTGTDTTTSTITANTTFSVTVN